MDGNQLTKQNQTGATTTYTYDGLGRLISEAQTGSATHSNTYSYDDYSNRQSASLSGISTAYTYDANNRLISSSAPGQSRTTSYTYDPQGNQTQSLLTQNGSVVAQLSFVYDGFNHLKSVLDSGSETKYTYNADGLRQSKVVDNIVCQRYVWDGDQLVRYTLPVPW